MLLTLYLNIIIVIEMEEWLDLINNAYSTEVSTHLKYQTCHHLCASKGLLVIEQNFDTDQKMNPSENCT